MSKRSLSSAFSSPSKVPKSSAENKRNFAQFGSSKGSPGEALSPGRRLVGSRKIPNGEAFSQDTIAADLLVAEKIINDPIHTAIKLDKLSCKIVDTPQFQRLRHLKQLGTCVFVFPSAMHTRFEHSMGVAHLAERVCKKLQTYQPELDITDVDILAVKIAGLCHDLGHGPFSHVYDGVFIREMFPDGLDGKGQKWRHEDGSVAMFRHMLAENSIDLVQYGLSAVDQVFIEEIIGGEKESSRKGRAPDKFYLYDIVNNTRSGLDVDKLDYFQRDMRFSNVTFAANFERFIELGRVIRAHPINDGDGTNFTRRASGGWITSQSSNEAASAMSPMGSATGSCSGREENEYQLMICYPQKLVFEAIDMFSVRFRMHKTVYTHKAVKQVEYMITDILREANDHIKIKGKKTKDFPTGLYSIAECIHCMEALSNLNDSVIEIIRYDQNPALAGAKQILHRLESRQLYTCLGKSRYTREDVERGVIKSEEVMAGQMVEISKQLVSGTFSTGGIEVDIDMLKGDQELMMDAGNSQDSFYSVSQFTHPYDGGASDKASSWDTLDLQDIIVEKMHIHYGLKDKNPVSRMRFFPKLADSDTVGTQIKDRVYQTSMPTVFEEFAVRVFCRTQGKEATARKVFQLWCRERLCQTPFQTDLQGDDAVSQI